jgi:hypothetical protein
VTTTQNHPGTTSHTPPADRGIAALIRVLGDRLSDRVHAAADDRARAWGWEVTETAGRLGLRGRSYRDPRFAARRQDHQNAQAGRGGRHE